MSTTNPIAVRGVSAVAVESQSDAYTRRSEIIEIAQFCPPAVTDSDTQAEVTNAVRPELVDLVVVRRADIITRIRQGEREIPGLRIYQDTRVTVRT